jgi:hypothetical protein
MPSWAVGTLVLVAAVIHVLGELWMSTGSWAIVFGLSPEWAHGQYQSTYFAGRQIGDMLSPPLITFCVLGLHTAGWYVLGAVFLLGGLLYRPLAAWAATNHHEPASKIGSPVMNEGAAKDGKGGAAKEGAAPASASAPARP